MAGAGSQGHAQAGAGLRFGQGRFDGAAQLQHTRQRGFSATNPNVPFGSYNDDNDGFRQNSATRFTQFTLGGNYLVGHTTDLRVRFSYTDAPKAQNPGALTRAEVLANPDSAGANNLLRKADKDVSQGQLALTGTHYTSRGRIDVAVFGLLRYLDNPLATPPPQGTGADVGTYVAIDRQVYGIRLATEQRLGQSERAPRVTAGIDLQRMRDNRENWRAVAGVRDTLFIDCISP